MLNPVRIAGPTVSPVSLEDVRLHLRIDHTDEDPVLQAYIDAATAYLDGPQGILGKSIVSQTWRQDYAAFTSPLLLPLQPVQSVSEITYYDSANAVQTLAPATYALIANAYGGPQVVLATGQSWPPSYVRDDAVSVTFLAGYGDPLLCPAPVRQAMLLLIGDWYARREMSGEAKLSELPIAFHMLIANYREALV